MLISSKKLLPVLPILLFSSALQAASLTEISDDARGKPDIQVNAISGDGSLVTGVSLIPSTPTVEAFKWESGTISNLPGNLANSRGSAVSTDGAFIAGVGVSGTRQAIRWSSSSSTALGILGGSGVSSALGVSGDGSVVVGTSPSATLTSNTEAFLWTVNGMRPLTGISRTGLTFSEASAVSADGTVITGSFTAGGSQQAFRYEVSDTTTGAGTATPLGFFAGGTISRGLDISADGSTVVGDHTSAAGTQAFRHVGMTMTGLSDLPGGAFFSSANATSADGSIVVGNSITAAGSEAFIWDATNGMRRLQDVLNGLGVNTTGWVLTDARDISDDGTRIVGVGTNNGDATGWIVDLSNNPGPNADPSPDSGSDFNNDGNDDVLWRNTATGENGMYLMNGINIATVGSINNLADSDWKIAGIGDFDNDGNEDILWRNQATGENMIYLMNGLTIKSESAILTVGDTNWTVSGVGDFNNDGNSDIHWFNTVTGETYIFLMNGFTISALQQSITAPANWIPVGVGDFDKDRKSDILWRNSVSGENYVLLMNGLNIASQGSITTVADTNWSVAGIGDFDNDEKSDVLWRNSATGETYIFLMDGIGTKSMGSLVTVGDLNWRPVHVADFNGDNKADVFWRNSITGQNWMLQLNGISISLSQAVSTVGDLNWKVNGD